MFETVKLGGIFKSAAESSDTGPGVTRGGQPPVDPSSLAFTGRIANWSATHRWWVVATSVMILVLAVLASSTFKVKLLDEGAFAEGESGEATADDVAYGVLFLASDESSFMTGSELVIDGGFTAM